MARNRTVITGEAPVTINEVITNPEELNQILRKARVPTEHKSRITDGLIRAATMRTRRAAHEVIGNVRGTTAKTARFGDLCIELSGWRAFARVAADNRLEITEIQRRV